MNSKSQTDVEMKDGQKSNTDSELDNEIDHQKADEVVAHKINGRSIKDFSEVGIQLKNRLANNCLTSIWL